MRNIQPFNGFAPMQDIERLLNKMFPKNSALVLILLHARKLDGRFYLSGGLWSVLWPGSTIPAVFPKTMKCLSVLHKLFAPLLPSALYSSGFSLLVQLLTIRQSVDRCLYEFGKQISEGGLDALAVYSTLFYRAAFHSADELRFFRKHINKLNCLFSSELCHGHVLSEDELEELTDEIDLINQKLK